MELIDVVMLNIGAFFLIAGGLILLAAIVGLAGCLAGRIWIKASNQWRAILRAESLIYEYKRNRFEFLEWKEKKDAE